MCCAFPGGLEVSGGIVEENHVTLERHWSSSVDLTHANSCQLNSTPMTPPNCSHCWKQGITATATSMWRDEWTTTTTRKNACDRETMMKIGAVTTFAIAQAALAREHTSRRSINIA